MAKWNYLVVVLFILFWPLESARTAFVPSEVFEYTGNGSLTIYNTHTQELENVRYKEAPGEYLNDGVAELNRLLRCRLTDQETQMSLKLIELVANIQDHFNASRVEIISGYRSPTLNFNLRSSGHKVASHSLHMQGLAMDIRIPGVSLYAIRDYVKSLRVGGVGFYPGQFVHVDVGPVRYW